MSPFIRAHGYLPGPTERPVAAGLITGAAAAVAALPLPWLSGALSQLAREIDVRGWLCALVFATFLSGAGALYGWIFMRAANDRRGGWLFGISFGFLLWMLGPVSAAQWLLGRPVLLSGASQGFFAAHLLYGLVLGLAFPSLHRLIQPNQRVCPGVTHGWGA